MENADPITVKRTIIEQADTSDTPGEVPFNGVGFVISITEAQKKPCVALLVVRVGPKGQLSIVPGRPGLIL